MVIEIVALLHKYVDLFLQSFTEMKGMDGELEEMKIQLKLGARPIKKTYRMNQHYKKQVKQSLDQCDHGTRQENRWNLHVLIFADSMRPTYMAPFLLHLVTKFWKRSWGMRHILLQMDFRATIRSKYLRKIRKKPHLPWNGSHMPTT